MTGKDRAEVAQGGDAGVEVAGDGGQREHENGPVKGREDDRQAGPDECAALQRIQPHQLDETEPLEQVGTRPEESARGGHVGDGHAEK